MGRLSGLLDLPADRPPRIVAIAPHPDDLEIGAGGTIIRLVEERPDLEILWLVLSGTPERAAEAAASARALTSGLASPVSIVQAAHRDGYFPGEWTAVKETLAVHGPWAPDLVVAPRREDLHQDHRLVAEIAWQVFRTATVLEYEIPKWEGDVAAVNIYVPLSAATVERKVAHLMAAFPSQSGKDWYTESTFRALLRLRGLEARAADGFAEGFVCRKLVA